MINIDLHKYIYEVVVPQYAAFDAALQDLIAEPKSLLVEIERIYDTLV